jgi:CHAD domain-containing protein
MRPNGSEKSSAAANLERQIHLVFARISRYAGGLSKNAKTSDVHHFRTHSRRVEALIADLAPDTRNKKKLLKLLSKLRKKAGKVRDLDVEISFLKNLRIPDRQNHRSQLLEWFDSEHARRSRKLPKSFEADIVRELRKRLRRSKTEMKLGEVDPLKLALSRLPKLGAAELNEKNLHSCRIAAKHARYLAELVDSASAKSFVDELKKAQDVIGEWHDVLKLKEKAEQHFGGVHDSPLVAALENISRARFRRARSSLVATLATLSEYQRGATVAGERKPAKFDSPAPTTAVA